MAGVTRPGHQRSRGWSVGLRQSGACPWLWAARLPSKGQACPTRKVVGVGEGRDCGPGKGGRSLLGTRSDRNQAPSRSWQAVYDSDRV